MAIIGIDLGTTNSLVSVWKNGQPVLIPNSFGEYLTPSVVGIDDKGNIITGKIAKERLISHPGKTAASFKRFMPYGNEIRLDKKSYSPAEISSFLLRRLKEDAESFLGEPVEEAVISVPAYFDDNGRNATKLAGELAGLRVERIVNEPSAAALFCNYKNFEEKTILVFDFGGGTLDVSIVNIFDNIIEIEAVAGDNRLGGDDFNRLIAEYFCTQNGINTDDLTAEQHAVLIKQSELCKIALSTQDKAAMAFNLKGEMKTLVLDNDTLYSFSQPLFKRVEAPIVRAIRDAMIDLDEIDEVIMVGGSSRMAVTRRFIRDLFNREVVLSSSADTAVAKGAAIAAAIKERVEGIKNVILTDICPFTLGTGVHNNVNANRTLYCPMVDRNSTLPASVVRTFCNTQDYQEKIVVEIAQGEKPYLDQNLLLGKLELPIPKGLAGQVQIEIRFTYDINGIIQVDVYIPSTDYRKSKLIINESNRMSEDEIKKRLKELDKIKIHPRDVEENQLLLARAEALYEETTGGLRDYIQGRTNAFAALLEKQKLNVIRNARAGFEAFLNEVEKSIANPFDSFDFSSWDDSFNEDEE